MKTWTYTPTPDHRNELDAPASTLTYSELDASTPTLTYLATAFSLNMLSSSRSLIAVCEATSDEVKTILDNKFENAVGHPSTASLLSALTGRNITANRLSVSLKKGDKILVFQYMGSRLQEGATELPEGASCKWLLVTIVT